jgi:hypothetical protein
MPQRSAAQSLYPHLPSGAREPVQQRTPNISDSMWPGLSRAAKAREHDQQLWNQILKRQRDSLVRGLREANANLERGRR